MMRSIRWIIVVLTTLLAITAYSAEKPYLPGSILSLIDLENLPLIDENVNDGMFSSTDPQQQGNDHGHYLRMEDGEYVMAEMEGPGVVTRIWSANAHGKLRIYLDDKTKPAIECMFKDIFEDRFPPFASPISMRSSGGWYSYFPIGYEKYCRISVTEDPSLSEKRNEARKPKKVSLSVKGVKELKLIVNDASDGFGNDHADWADAKLIKADGTVLYLSDIKDNNPDVKLVSTKQQWGGLMMDKSVGKNPLSINGRKYEKGLGTHTNGEIIYELTGEFEKFEAEVGLDDESVPSNEGSIIFRVETDGKQVFDSGILGFPKFENALNPRSLYYHINYSTYPAGTKILPFKRELSEAENTNLKRVLDIWKNAGACPTEAKSTDNTDTSTINLKEIGTAQIAGINGSGFIYSIKMKLKSEDKRAYRRTVIKMYWDGDKNPAVWAPYGDFFGSGFGHVEFNSLPIGMGKSSGNGRSGKEKNPDGTPVATLVGEDESYCYWVMPFAKGARIEIENGNKVPIEVTTEIKWRRMDSIPANMGRFCAQWRNEWATKDKLITLLDVKGKGKYVGLFMSVQGIGEISYLEGNEQYFIDGEEKPSMIGTGTEDFFNGGWYYERGVFDRPLHGLNEKEHTLAGRTCQYRLQVPDAVTFRTAFKLLIEHGTNNIHLDNDYAMVTYFYMIPPLPHDFAMPKASEMNFPRKILARPNLPGRGAVGDEVTKTMKMRGGRFAEHIFDIAKSSCPKELRFWKDISEGYEGTNMSLFFWWPLAYLIRDPKQDPRLEEPYRGDVIICDAKKAGDYLEIPPASEDTSAGSYIGRYWLVKGPDYGIVKILVAGKVVVESVDLYAEEVMPSDMVGFGPLDLPEGAKTLRIEVIGKNEKSKGMKFGLYVEKTAQALIVPEAWKVIGPFPFDITSPEESFKVTYPPEKEIELDAKYDGKQDQISWVDMPKSMVEGDDFQSIEFGRGIPMAHGATAYAVTTVESPADMEVILKIGHSKPTAIFINGEKIYEKNVQRDYSADQDSAKVSLRKGANTLLIKTSNTQDLWKVGLRFTDSQGKPLTKLSFKKTE